MPEYVASGSHHFKQTKYRFLILPRFKCDLNTIIEHRQIDTKSLLVVAVQILDVLEHLHDRGYAHSDIKAENLMLGQCTYKRSEYDFSRVDQVATDLAAIKASRTADAADENPDEDQVKVNTTQSRSKKSNSSSGVDSDFEENESDEMDESEIVSGEDKSVYFTPSPLANRSKPLSTVEFSGSNPVRSCRMSRKNSIYEDMLNTHYLRPSRKVSYFCDDDDQEENDDKNDLNFRMSGSGRKRQQAEADHRQTIASDMVTEDRIFVIDFGLAIKFVDSSGTHRPFCMDQRRAHDGTLEFTSRDAHMGAHSRRSDLECLGYNLIYWLKGSLPWKDDKLMQQPEQVHRMKEYFMTDIEVMYKHIYGSPVPTFVGQFMEYVGGLAYHDRPDYNLCRCIFAAELQRIGCNLRTDMSLSLAELRKRPRKSDKEMENNNAAAVKIKDVKSMMRLSLMIPFKESGSNRISPKNLRSKSDKLLKKHKVKFSWTDILSTDPDQIARQRAEKEYDHNDTPLLCRYRGKPTYAILELEKRMKFKDKLDARPDDCISFVAEPPTDPEESCSSQASSKSTLRKNKTQQQNEKRRRTTTAATPTTATNLNVRFATTEKHPPHTAQGIKVEEAAADDHAAHQSPRKSGLRRSIRPTEKSISYQKSVAAKRQSSQKKPTAMVAKRTMVPNSEFSASEESSSCSSSSSNVHPSNAVAVADEDHTSSSSNDSERFAQRRGSAAPRYNSSSCGMSFPVSDEDDDEQDDTDDDDDEDYIKHFSPIKTRRIRRNAAFKQMAAKIPLSDRCK